MLPQQCEAYSTLVSAEMFCFQDVSKIQNIWKDINDIPDLCSRPVFED